MYTHKCGDLRSSEEDVESSGARNTGGCEPSDTGTGNQSWVLYENTLLTTKPCLQIYGPKSMGFLQAGFVIKDMFVQPMMSYMFSVSSNPDTSSAFKSLSFLPHFRMVYDMAFLRTPAQGFYENVPSLMLGLYFLLIQILLSY